MDTLFPIAGDHLETPLIPGLEYLPDYVTSVEEASLVNAIDAAAWNTSWSRRRQFYGKSYQPVEKQGRAPPGAVEMQESGERREASPPFPPAVEDPIPEWAQFLIHRTRHGGLSERPFDQMLVNEYLAGQGIALHRDHEPFDRTVASLSLLSACVMDFRQIETNRRESLLLEPRSLLVLSDDARYGWEHGIARRKADRWRGRAITRRRRLSVTLRLRRRDDAADRQAALDR